MCSAMQCDSFAELVGLWMSLECQVSPDIIQRMLDLIQAQGLLEPFLPKNAISSKIAQEGDRRGWLEKLEMEPHVRWPPSSNLPGCMK